MPYAPVLGRAEARPQGPTRPSVAPDRDQLIASIGVCQQQLADLLGRLDATAGTPGGEPAAAAPPDQQVEVVRARQAVEETMARLDDAVAPEPRAVQLTEFEERVWRRLVEAMRTDGRRLEAAVQAAVAAAQGDVSALGGALQRLDTELTQLVATIDDRIAHHLHPVRIAVDEVATLRGDVAALRRLDADLAHLTATIDDRIAHHVQPVRSALGEVAALRGDVATMRREHAALAAELGDTNRRQAAAARAELTALGGALQRLDTEVMRVIATIDDRIAHQVRRVRLGVDEEMAMLRTWVESAIASSTGGIWSVLGRLVRDPLGVLAAAASFLPGRRSLGL